MKGTKDRWNVKIDSDGQVLNLNAANLKITPVAAKQPPVAAAKVALNSLPGTVTSGDR